MHALRTAIFVAWAVFWVGWLVAARWSKRGSGRPVIASGARIMIAAGIVLGGFGSRLAGRHTGTVHSLALEIVGTVLFVAGLALAIWARVLLGRNWGMPMTLKDEPELVTSGPYRIIRHPIYTGILLAVLGTAIATDVFVFIIFAAMAVYFSFSARVEDRLMARSFPATYPEYHDRTKMLIPFVL
jgi:protein-S-isoprenylcysteine O-methyltransferase Ste14